MFEVRLSGVVRPGSVCELDTPIGRGFFSVSQLFVGHAFGHFDYGGRNEIPATLWFYEGDRLGDIGGLRLQLL